MMQTYMAQTEDTDKEKELLDAFSNKLSLSNSREEVENEVSKLLHSLEDLNLSKSKIA